MDTAESKPRSSARRRYAPISASVAVRGPRAKLGRRRPNLMPLAPGGEPVPALLFFERAGAIFLALRFGLFAASRLIGGHPPSLRRGPWSRRRGRAVAPRGVPR